MRKAVGVDDKTAKMIKPAHSKRKLKQRSIAAPLGQNW
jgi:hypothetical protein